MSCKPHGPPGHLHKDPNAGRWSSYCVALPYCMAMVTLCGPHYALNRMPSHGICFEHGQSVHRCSAFYAIPQRLQAEPLRCCRDACDRSAHTLAFCIFLGHCFVCFVALRPRSTAMVMAGRSIHLTTLFPGQA